MNTILRLVAEHRELLSTLRPRPTTDVHELLDADRAHGARRARRAR